jgi:3-oxoacyl-[acyl-carrier-protein] synthase II
MNCAAGQSAIWHGLQGPNATISCGEISSFASFNYAVSLLKNNYVDTLVAGGSEELSEVSIAAKTSIAKKNNSFQRFSEGSAFFVFETNDIASKFKRTVMATVNSVKIGYNPQINDAAALIQLIEQALQEANLSSEDINLVSYSGAWPQTSEVETLALSKLFGDKANSIPTVVQYEITGNAVSSQNAFQLSTVIEKLSQNQTGLLFAQDLKGNIGAMIITKNISTGDKL